MSTGFFAGLAKFTGKANIQLMVNELPDEKLNVIIMVKPLDPKADAALAQTYQFRGTPEELDTGLIAGLPEVATSYLSMADTIASIKTVQEAATKQAADAAAAKKAEKSKGKTVLPAGTAASSDEDDNESGGDGASTGAGTAATPTAPAASSQATAAPANLFD